MWEKVVFQRVQEFSKDVNMMWSKDEGIIKDVVREVLVVFKGIFKGIRKVWWWNVDV